MIILHFPSLANLLDKVTSNSYLIVSRFISLDCNAELSEF